jgi:transposase
VAQNLTKVGGLGTLTANQLVAIMPEVDTRENKQAATVASIARQSGH